MTKITELPTGSTPDGSEFGIWDQKSSTVTMTETTISALASDNSFNDSADGFVTAGFAEGDTVVVSGFTESANNLTTGVITALTAGKMTIGGTDGDGITDEVAGDSVTISKWVTVRIPVDDLPSGGGGLTMTRDQVTMSADASVTWNIPAGTEKIEFIVRGDTSATGAFVSVELVQQADDGNATFNLEGKHFEGATFTWVDTTADLIISCGGGAAAPSVVMGGNIFSPRASGEKTLAAVYGDASGTARRNINWRAECDAAEDHDQLKISVSSGTVTGTVDIIYWS